MPTGGGKLTQESGLLTIFFILRLSYLFISVRKRERKDESGREKMREGERE